MFFWTEPVWTNQKAWCGDMMFHVNKMGVLFFLIFSPSVGPFWFPSHICVIHRFLTPPLSLLIFSFDEWDENIWQNAGVFPCVMESAGSEMGTVWFYQTDIRHGEAYGIIQHFILDVSMWFCLIGGSTHYSRMCVKLCTRPCFPNVHQCAPLWPLTSKINCFFSYFTELG